MRYKEISGTKVITQTTKNKDSKKDDETKNKGRRADAKTRKSRDGT
ncbi:MAG: hypothetical protein QXH07_02170 [Thermoplasmata archaeon]